MIDMKTGHEPGADKETPFVSVVVVTLNAAHLLRNCLASLTAQDYGSFEILVVDNASDEDIRGMLEAEFPHTRYLRMDTNSGFAGGNNAGIELARGAYVALINNDATADPGWLSALVRCAEADPGIGAVASLVLDGNHPGVLDSYGVGVAFDGISRQALRGVPAVPPPPPREQLAISGCACLFRMAALEQTGLFDADFFAYCEDTDLSLRLRRAGWTIMGEPDARVTHFYSQTGGPFSKRKVLWVERNRFWVAIKNFPVFMLPAVPFFSLWRYMVQLYALLRGLGTVACFVQNTGGLGGLAVLVRANIAAWAHVPHMVRKRLAFRPPARISGIAMARLLSRFRLSMYEVIVGCDPAKGSDTGVHKPCP